MAERKNIPASVRWHIFARDGFTCRYCGARAGQDGVHLQADHVVSVAEGGDNHPDNLVTACQRCNVGKGARSLSKIPTTQEVVRRVLKMAATLQEQADAVQGAVEAKQTLEQQIVNLKCAAYDVKNVHIGTGELTAAANLMREFGADKVLEWYSLAAARRVTEWKAIQYVCGIARNVRQEREDAE